MDNNHNVCAPSQYSGALVNYEIQLKDMLKSSYLEICEIGVVLLAHSVMLFLQKD